MDKDDIRMCLLVLSPFMIVVLFWLFVEPTTFWQRLISIVLCVPLYFIVLRLEICLLE